LREQVTNLQGLRNAAPLSPRESSSNVEGTVDRGRHETPERGARTTISTADPSLLPSSAEDIAERGQQENEEQPTGRPIATEEPSLPPIARQPVFGTGELVLVPNGKLHLSPGATFYRATPQGSSETRDNVETSQSTQAGPCHTITTSDSRTIITLAFDHTVSFSMHGIEEQFWRDFEQAPHVRTAYYSPFLRLVLLAIGWRSCSDRDLIQRYYGDFHSRGADAAAAARRMVDWEAENPMLSSIMGLYLLSGYLVGMSQE
jgi:hypothetical protein